MPTLWLIPADTSKPATPIAATGTTLGRDASCAIRVNDPSVSRHHALFEEDGGSWVLSDQKSANGTWVDGQRVHKAYLRPGQTVRFGAVSFDVSAEDPASRPREAAPLPTPPPVASSAPPPAPARPVSAPVAGGGMTAAAAAAAELLGVRAGASRDEVRQRYQKIYNDYQIRLTNAPTAALKRMYQKNLQDLKAAAEVLAPGIIADLRT